MQSADYWIKKLNLIEYPYGGYFKETYRSHETIAPEGLPERFSGPRSISTAIYFLLKGYQKSGMRRLQADEVWHFHTGSSLTLHNIDPNGRYSSVTLGSDADKGQVFQAVMRARHWFGFTVDDPESYTLVGCTVAPGFDIADREMGNRVELLQEYPEHAALIERLTNHSDE